MATFNLRKEGRHFALKLMCNGEHLKIVHTKQQCLLWAKEYSRGEVAKVRVMDGNKVIERYEFREYCTRFKPMLKDEEITAAI